MSFWCNNNKVLAKWIPPKRITLSRPGFSAALWSLRSLTRHFVFWVRRPKPMTCAAACWWWGRQWHPADLSPVSLPLLHFISFFNLNLPKPCLLTFPYWVISLHPSPATAGKMQTHWPLKEQHTLGSIFSEQWHWSVYGFILNLSLSCNPWSMQLIPFPCWSACFPRCVHKHSL